MNRADPGRVCINAWSDNRRRQPFSGRRRYRLAYAAAHVAERGGIGILFTGDSISRPQIHVEVVLPGFSHAQVQLKARQAFRR
jgi:hypothetical protein